jgi:hypothetical protein
VLVFAKKKPTGVALSWKSQARIITIPCNLENRIVICNAIWLL